MGGRGSAGGVSDKGIKYGQEYHNLLGVENIKFVKRNNGAANAPLETMSALKNRVYVTVNKDEQLKAITLYDSSGKRTREIHFADHKGMGVHFHKGYDYADEIIRIAYPLTTKDKNLVNKVKKYWKEHLEW